MRRAILLTALIGALSAFDAARAHDDEDERGRGRGRYEKHERDHGGFDGRRHHRRSRRDYDQRLFHDDLTHGDYHRRFGHREAHRGPLGTEEHERLHDRLGHEAYHDRMDHREYHRDHYDDYGDYRPYGRYRPDYGWNRRWSYSPGRGRYESPWRSSYRYGDY